MLVGRPTTFQLRLVADERFFLVLLIPEQEGATVLYDLDPGMNAELIQLATALGATLQSATEGREDQHRDNRQCCFAVSSACVRQTYQR